MSAPSAAAPAPPTVRQVLVVFSGLLLATLLAALDSTIVATALPTIVDELGGLERLGWVVTAYLLAQTIATPLYGKLGDLYGRKIVLQTGIAIFLLGSALCGLSESMIQLALFRFLQVVNGASPTASGLQLLPMMGGMLVTSIASGQLISRWGRYKAWTPPPPWPRRRSPCWCSAPGSAW